MRSRRDEPRGHALAAGGVLGGCRWAGLAAALAFSVGVSAVSLSTSRAQPADPSGIEFVTIGAVGNAGYFNPLYRAANGRGVVNYEYRMGKYEVTTSQWVEFFSAALARAERLPWVDEPFVWGATTDGRYTGPGQRFVTLPGQEMRAVGGITWRTAAMYCNWLHNDKRIDRSAFMSGVYDVSTFGDVGPGFTDQAVRSPGARYFIPTVDEWLKAAHYDPNKNGDGQGGWWDYSTRSDARPRYGLPPSMGGTGQVNAYYTDFPLRREWTVPLGAYTEVTSPWGLFDVAGATSEWCEDVYFNRTNPNFGIARGLDGSHFASGDPGIGSNIDGGWGLGSGLPSDPFYGYGFRVASVVPTPGTVCVFGMIGALVSSRRRGR
jgi:formylglycine-generating enzyme required for sulfatase activity